MPVVFATNTAVTSQDLNTMRAASWEDFQASNWDLILQRSLGWVCATDGGRLVGFVNVLWDGGAHAFLLDTTVHRDYQHRGIGTALVQEAVALARASGAEWLHVDYEAALEPFYRGCGFRPTRAGLLRLTDDATASGGESEQGGA